MNKINLTPLVTFMQETMYPDEVADMINDMLIDYAIYVLKDTEREVSNVSGDVYYVHKFCKLLREAAAPPLPMK